MSTPRFALGLVVGKFAPLHRGHEALVAQAAAQCERLLILSYTRPEFTRCDVASRRRWLASGFPQHECLVIDDAWLAQACAERGLPARRLPPNSAADTVQQHFLAGLLQLLQRQPDALFCSEPWGPPCAQVLAQALGRPVQAVVWDPARQQVPISASRLRQAPWAAWHWLAPPVRASWVRRVLLLGGESTGKTTLAAALAQRLGADWVPEYGRTLWEAQGGQLAEADLLRIAREQLRQEEAAAQASTTGWLVCDTSPLTTLGYAGWMFGRADPSLAALAQAAQDRYDAVLLCADDLPFTQDGTRRDAAFRTRQQAWYSAQLAGRPAPCLRVQGPLAHRVASAVQWLQQQPWPTPTPCPDAP